MSQIYLIGVNSLVWVGFWFYFVDLFCVDSSLVSLCDLSLDIDRFQLRLYLVFD